MLNGEYVGALVKAAKAYRPDSQASILRNDHMNELDLSSQPSQRQIDAVVTDFINYVALRRGMDLALYTVDLRQPESEKGAPDA